ncbi:MAG: FecR family protein [Tannerellaceae bacterium]|jgi:ferric-dicitrate binding protein FerR (iron transport regulator)|nr:FecR family protein [Tannerellaceae bacterium]
MQRTILYKFFEGSTSYKEEERIKKWIEMSPENERIFFKERKLYDAMILLAGNNMTKGKPEKRSVYLRRITFEVIKIAAVALIVFLFSHRYSEVEPDVIAMQTIAVPMGQRTNIVLPDGTNVWLNSRSTLQYPTSFGREERKVILDGEAYMEVHKDTEKKFIVATDKGEIEVLGTSFNVDAYSDSDVFETSLMEGKLNVKDKNSSAHTVQLTPNMKATLINGKLQVEKITDYDQFSWKEGLISFKNLDVAQIMKKFEKCYGKKIILEDAQTTKSKHSGKFRQADGIDYALRILQKDIPMHYIRDEENYIVTIKQY